MSQADELINGLSDEEFALYTANPTEEQHIIVDENRIITVPSELKKIAVQYDHNIETVTFDCIRYWDGHDMSTMKVYINYTRSDKYTGCYLADNVRVDEADDSIMHFDWTISRNVTESAGPLTILVCVKMVDADGNEVNHWNSERNTDMTISNGMECGDIIVNKYPDVITYLLADMGNLADLTTEDKSSLVAAINEVRQTGGGSSVQPDWHQNDSTQPDYIKNRPFYTGDPVETVLVEEQTVAFSDMGWAYGVEGLQVGFDFVLGQMYDVSWDGTTYKCVCIAHASGALFVGNAAFFGGADTGEPFLFGCADGFLSAMTSSTQAEHTISITTIEQSITKIDTKYIPWSDAVGLKLPVIISKSDDFTDDEKQKYFDAFKNGSLVLYLGKNHAGVVVSVFYSKNVGFRMTVIDSNGYLYIYRSSDGWSSNDISENGIIRTIDNVLSDKTSWGLLKSDSNSVSIGEAFKASIRWNSTTKKPCIYKETRSSTSGVIGIENSDIFCSGDKDVILTSSTADSTKKFKITVDDSGTITATEVT